MAITDKIVALILLKCLKQSTIVLKEVIIPLIIATVDKQGQRKSLSNQTIHKILSMTRLLTNRAKVIGILILTSNVLINRDSSRGVILLHMTSLLTIIVGYIFQKIIHSYPGYILSPKVGI